MPFAEGSRGLSWGAAARWPSRYNASGNADVWVNESGASDGVWTQYNTPIGALWWTRGQEPGVSPWGPWAEIGASISCQGEAVQQWTSSSVYTGGDAVTHDGSSWSAKWWTRNEEPGTSRWGPWEQASSR